MRPARCAAPRIPPSMKSSSTKRAGGCSSAPTPTTVRHARPQATAAARARRRTRRGRMAENERAADNDPPLLIADGLSKSYGRLTACRDVSFALYPGEVLAVVGESGSGKTTLLQLLSAQLAPSAGHVSYRMRDGVMRDLAALGEAERRFLFFAHSGSVRPERALCFWVGGGGGAQRLGRRTAGGGEALRRNGPGCVCSG